MDMGIPQRGKYSIKNKAALDERGRLKDELIPALWKHTKLWQNHLLSLLDEHPKHLLFPIDKKIPTEISYLKSCSYMILFALYFEIPYQMGCLELSRKLKGFAKQFSRDKAGIAKKLRDVWTITQDWEDCLKNFSVEAKGDTSLLTAFNKQAPALIEHIEKAYTFSGFSGVKEPYLNYQNSNPLIGKKIYSPHTVRVMVSRYLNLLFSLLDIKFSSEYQKQNCIADAENLLFPAKMGIEASQESVRGDLVKAPTDFTRDELVYSIFNAFYFFPQDITYRESLNGADEPYPLRRHIYSILNENTAFYNFSNRCRK